MSIDYKRVYQEFDRLKSAKELGEYSSELDAIDQLLKTSPFDSFLASQLCSYLASKYEKEINQQSGMLGGKTVVKGGALPVKTAFKLRDDLQFFKNHIPVFALMREVKSDLLKSLFGL